MQGVLTWPFFTFTPGLTSGALPTCFPFTYRPRRRMPTWEGRNDEKAGHDEESIGQVGGMEGGRVQRHTCNRGEHSCNRGAGARTCPDVPAAPAMTTRGSRPRGEATHFSAVYLPSSQIFGPHANPTPTSRPLPQTHPEQPLKEQLLTLLAVTGSTLPSSSSSDS